MKRALLLSACLLGGCPRPAAESSTTTRIASVTIDSDATLWALGGDVRSKVVAVSSLVDDARYSPVVDTWPAALPRVDGSSETLVALRPSIVFMAEWSDATGRAPSTSTSCCTALGGSKAPSSGFRTPASSNACSCSRPCAT